MAQVPPTYRSAIEAIDAAITEAGDAPKSREASLTLTKLEEARLWAQEGQRKLDLAAGV